MEDTHDQLSWITSQSACPLVPLNDPLTLDLKDSTPVDLIKYTSIELLMYPAMLPGCTSFPPHNKPLAKQCWESWLTTRWTSKGFEQSKTFIWSEYPFGKVTFEYPIGSHYVEDLYTTFQQT